MTARGRWIHPRLVDFTFTDNLKVKEPKLKWGFFNIRGVEQTYLCKLVLCHSSSVSLSNLIFM